MNIDAVLTQLDTLIWIPVITGILGVGLYLSIGLKGLPWRRVKSAFVILYKGSATEKKEQISPLQGLMIALSASISSGGISGVAVAIALGGPGAVFWMWVTALLSMAVQYAEALLAVEYREKNEYGDYIGGPMYTIKNGLESKWHWLASLFAISATLAAFGMGNMVQANAIATAVAENFKVPDWQTAIVITCFSSIIILAGLARFAKLAVFLVPAIAVVYLEAALWIIFQHLAQLPGVFWLIVKNAFTPVAAVSGFAGATIWLAVRSGLEQGIFSNDAGFGRGAIAHAATNAVGPVRQGLIAMLGTVINLFFIGTVTALVILLSGAWSSGKSGLALSILAFTGTFHSFSIYIATLSLSLFTFMSILAWSFYAERCVIFLCGTKAIWPYRLLWLSAIPLGATHKIPVLWQLASIFNGLMAIPNLVALVLLAPVLFRLTSNYVRIED